MVVFLLVSLKPTQKRGALEGRGTTSRILGTAHVRLGEKSPMAHVGVGTWADSPKSLLTPDEESFNEEPLVFVIFWKLYDCFFFFLNSSECL